VTKRTAIELAGQHLDLVRAQRQKIDEFAGELEQKLGRLHERRRELAR
jgi:hypothetical protein